MAKFRKARRYVSKAKSFFKKGKSKGKSSDPLDMAIGGGIYGAARPMIAPMIPDFAPLGGYSDNLFLGGIGYLAAKKGTGMVRTAGLTVLTVESFIAGSKASQGIMGASNNSIVYG